MHRGPRTGEDLVAETVRCVVRRATASEGGAPRAIALARPAAWGEHRDRVLTAALAAVGLDDVLLVPDADAAVDAAPAVRTGELVGVLDLGAHAGGAVLVRRLRGRRGLRVTEPVGAPARRIPVGGTDVDDAVLDHVRAAVGDLPAGDDPDTRRALAELRRRCVGAKEALATRDEVVIDVDLPGHRVRVPLTRPDLDARVAPLVERAATALRELAGTAAPDAVVLVGGTARLPLVAETVATALGVAVRAQPDPGTLLACGAARAAGVHAARRRRAARGDRTPRTGPLSAHRATTMVITPGAPPCTTDEHPGAAVAITATPAGPTDAVDPVLLDADPAAPIDPAPFDPDPAAPLDPLDPADPADPADPDPADAVEVVPPRPGADVPRPAVTVAPVPEEVRSSRPPRGRGRLVLAAAAVVLALGAAAATVPVPGLTRGATSSPLPIAGTAPAPTGAAPLRFPPIAPTPTPSPAPSPAPSPGPATAPTPADRSATP